MQTSSFKIDAFSLGKMRQLSYHSQLKLSLKRNLHCFDTNELLMDVNNARNWYMKNIRLLESFKLDYRIKSMQSVMQKYNKFYPYTPVEKTFNDLVGFRTISKDYHSILRSQINELIKIVDMSKGKKNDDGYRGIHIYYQLNHHCYPIEVQFNTIDDFFFNRLLHIFIYKQGYDNIVGVKLRKMYDDGYIENEYDFKEAMKNVLRIS